MPYTVAPYHMEQPAPSLTIVLPVFNEAEGIQRLLLELERTVAGPVTIIVVDDGSSDDTYEVVKRFSAKKNDYSTHNKTLSKLRPPESHYGRAFSRRPQQH
ncbi:MAG: glycosyltransferase [Proteobacteria bacterium]|nr:glycosyltransferase [Pseudomonadota bacterium]